MSTTNTRLWRLVWFLCLLPTSSGYGRIIYVDADAPTPVDIPRTRGDPFGAGSTTGSSWADAYADLQTALAVARIGDEIRIARGVYTPSSPGSSLHSPMPYELTGGLTLVGGYAGFGEPDPNARDLKRYATILSGDVKGNDAPVDDPCDLSHEPTRADNCRIVSCYMPPRNILEGLTITGGRGAVAIGNISVTLRDCTFTSNLGGAIMVSAGDVHLENCRFLSNAAETWGGGLYLLRSSATIIKCEFAANYASIGGAVAATDSLVSLSRCAFRENSADSGGAVSHYTGSLQVLDCLFEKNRARHSGAAMTGDLMMLSGCRFIGNSAGHYGGALCDIIWPSKVSHCLFAGNCAPEGGAIYSYFGPLLLNCTLTGNRAAAGHAVAWPAQAPARARAGPTVVSPFRMTVTNCILWDGPGEMGSQGGRPAEIAVTYSDVCGGWPGEGNIDADPYFADPGRWNPTSTPDGPGDDVWVDGDYHLKSQAGRWDPVGERWVNDNVTSPCIDTGDPGSPIGDEPPPNGGRVNMGAYGGTAKAGKSFIGKPQGNLYGRELP